MDLRLSLKLAVFDRLHDFLRLLGRQAVLNFGDLPHSAAKRRLDASEAEGLDRYIALDQLRLENIHDALQLVLIIRHDDQFPFLFLQRQLGLRAFEVEPLRDLF